MTTLTGREEFIILLEYWCFYSSGRVKTKTSGSENHDCVSWGSGTRPRAVAILFSIIPVNNKDLGVNSGNRVYLKHWDFDPNPVLVQKVGLPCSLTFWVFACIYISLTKPFDIPTLASIIFLVLERAKRSEMPTRSTMSVCLSGLDVSILLVQEPWPVSFSFVEYFFQHILIMHLQYSRYFWSSL